MTAPNAGLVVLTLSADELDAKLRELVEEVRASEKPKVEAALLSTTELATKLSCSRALVHKLAAAKKIRSKWLGDERRFVLADVLADIEKMPAPQKRKGGRPSK